MYHKWVFERAKVLRSAYTLHEFLRVAIVRAQPLAHEAGRAGAAGSNRVIVGRGSLAPLRGAMIGRRLLSSRGGIHA